MKHFDAKIFNGEAFGKYVSIIPNTKKNELLKSGAIQGNQEIKDAFANQTGTHYATLPMHGRIGGKTLNYNGSTNVTATSTKTYSRGVISIGRMAAWTEKDFSYDITGGVDFMDNVAKQVVDFWADAYQGILLSILKGIFAMNSGKDKEFAEGHTYNITELACLLYTSDAADD